MARIATILSVLVSAATIQTAFASPSCAYRYKGKPECLEKCKESWGWSDGLLNSNPWGSVVISDKVKDTIEAYIAQACGSRYACTFMHAQDGFLTDFQPVFLRLFLLAPLLLPFLRLLRLLPLL